MDNKVQSYCTEMVLQILLHVLLHNLYRCTYRYFDISALQREKMLHVGFLKINKGWTGVLKGPIPAFSKPSKWLNLTLKSQDFIHLLELNWHITTCKAGRRLSLWIISWLILRRLTMNEELRIGNEVNWCPRCRRNISKVIKSASQ